MSYQELYYSMRNSIIPIKMEQTQERINKEKEKVKNLIADLTYISWLNEYTITHPNMTNKMIPVNATELEKENIKNLKFFYTGILEYAESIKFHPVDTKFEKYYKIRYYQNYFHVGEDLASFQKDKDSEIFCDRMNLPDVGEYLDILDVIDQNKVKLID